MVCQGSHFERTLNLTNGHALLIFISNHDGRPSKGFRPAVMPPFLSLKFQFPLEIIYKNYIRHPLFEQRRELKPIRYHNLHKFPLPF